MTHSMAWLAAILAGWGLLFLLFIRPMLAEIHRVMGAGLSWFEGAKTNFLGFGISMVSVVGVVADNTDLLDQFKDLSLWTNIVGSNGALKIVSVLTLVIPVLHLIGKLKAAKTPPQAD